MLTQTRGATDWLDILEERARAGDTLDDFMRRTGTTPGRARAVGAAWRRLVTLFPELVARALARGSDGLRQRIEEATRAHAQGRALAAAQCFDTVLASAGVEIRDGEGGHAGVDALLTYLERCVDLVESDAWLLGFMNGLALAPTRCRDAVATCLGAVPQAVPAFPESLRLALALEGVPDRDAFLAGFDKASRFWTAFWQEVALAARHA